MDNQHIVDVIKWHFRARGYPIDHAKQVYSDGEDHIIVTASPRYRSISLRLYEFELEYMTAFDVLGVTHIHINPMPAPYGGYRVDARWNNEFLIDVDFYTNEELRSIPWSPPHLGPNDEAESFNLLLYVHPNRKV